jgi:hypothetical protein
MLRQLMKETLIVCAGTLVFLILCATVGISTSERNDAPIVIAQEQRLETGEAKVDQPPDGMDRAFGQGDN